MKNALWIVALLMLVGGCAAKQPLSSQQSDTSTGQLPKKEVAQRKYKLLEKQLFEHPWFQQDEIPAWDKDGNDLGEDWYRVPKTYEFIVPVKSRGDAVSMLEEQSFVQLETREAKSMLGYAGIGVVPPEGYSFYLVRALSIIDLKHTYFHIEQKGGSVSIGIHVDPDYCDELKKLPLIILLKTPPDEVYHFCMGLE